MWSWKKWLNFNEQFLHMDSFEELVKVRKLFEEMVHIHQILERIHNIPSR